MRSGFIEKVRLTLRLEGNRENWGKNIPEAEETSTKVQGGYALHIQDSKKADLSGAEGVRGPNSGR